MSYSLFSWQKMMAKNVKLDNQMYLQSKWMSGDYKQSTRNLH